MVPPEQGFSAGVGSSLHSSSGTPSQHSGLCPSLAELQTFTATQEKHRFAISPRTCRFNSTLLPPCLEMGEISPLHRWQRAVLVNPRIPAPEHPCFPPRWRAKAPICSAPTSFPLALIAMARRGGRGEFACRRLPPPAERCRMSLPTCSAH